MKKSTLAAVLASLALNPPPREEPRKDACKMCGHSAKASTGECSYCGVYRCSTCKKYHLGDPAPPCPGHGVAL